MSENKTQSINYNQKVTIHLFKDNYKYRDDVLVIVNGKTFIIKRGVDVEVPLFVKLALDDAAAQENEASKYISSVIDA